MKLFLWILKKILNSKWAEKIIIIIAFHEALYDLFPGLQKTTPFGLGKVMLNFLRKNQKACLAIPRSEMHGYPDYYIEITPCFNNKKGLLIAVYKLEKNKGSKKVFIRTPCRHTTFYLNRVFENLWQHYHRSLWGAKEALRRIGVNI